MIYFICWAAFLGILILATILVAVMGKNGSRGSKAVDPAEADYDEVDMDEAVPDEAAAIEEAPAEAAEEFAAPAGDDFAEFESEFK